MENLLVPYQAVTEIPCSKAVVLAPHPDDEIFGCGGAILRHVAKGIPLRVIVVTDGAYELENEARAVHILLRQQESRAAAGLLGYGEPEFWGMRDREVAYGEKLVRRILECLEDADLVYAPSVFEMHPDHRALGMAAVEAVRRCGKGVRLALYEVGMPLRPNLLLDISDLMVRKQAAMACFVSQNAIQRYDLDIAALNRYRTYTLPDNVTAAEAYILTGADELAGDPFGLYQSEYNRQKALGLYQDGDHTPLVSVIIRSMDRPTLEEALDSVALQTYPNIEVVLVNAKGAGHRDYGGWCGRFPLRIVGQDVPLRRSRAANLGLKNARGEYLIFLDDDDLFHPDHIEVLVRLLEGDEMGVAAYSGVGCLRPDKMRENEFIRVFNEAFDATKLLFENYIPIHAALFRRAVDGTNLTCKFDDAFDLFEDWDFWMQLMSYGYFLHSPKITAIYRIHGGSGAGVEANAENALVAFRAIVEKWRQLWTTQQLMDVIARGRFLEKRYLENEKRYLENEKRYLEREHQILHSLSWKLTAPLRWISRKISLHSLLSLKPERFSRSSKQHIS